MTSPDLTPYLDLRVYDRDTQDVVDAALQDLQSKLPGWVPREDNTEVMLIEALSLEVSESIFAINRIPGAIMTILMQFMGITRDEGAPPVASITVTAADTLGYTIPEGTRWNLALSGGLDPVVFTNAEAVDINNGDLAATFDVVGNRYTDEANGVIAGTPLELLDAVSFIESTVLAGSVTDGRDPETDNAWATRGVARLSRLTDTLAVPKHFTMAALEYPYVERATTLDIYNSDAGSGAPGDHPGHVSVAVYGPGRLLTTDEKNAIKDDFEGRSLANLMIHVMDPTITDVDVSVTVQRFANYSDDDTTTAITQALTNYLNPATWPWAGTVRWNELIALISNLPQVDYVTTLTTPATDFALSGYAPLANVGTVTVTVTS
jgi:uncharacterized phage protein gp47/JayE